MPLKENEKDIWDDFWSRYDFSGGRDADVIRQELSSVRWKKIQKRINGYFGKLKGLEVVEIGSGRGEAAVAMALGGASVTLVDYSQTALDKAGDLFDHMGQTASFIKADIFDLPGDLLQRFDISMSFGLAEHFDYPSRRDVFKIHADLLKPSGASFIAVPNAYCLPYRFFMLVSTILGYRHGFEKPFSRAELKRLAASAGFGAYEIVGSSFIRDTCNFLFIRYICHLTRWKIRIDTTKIEIPSPFDDYFGYSLVAIGKKS
jgi:2-polyprenyl-3-methyl-5-hydroxy-6-metoxy-1,4-benzoquinol methylase